MKRARMTLAVASLAALQLLGGCFFSSGLPWTHSGLIGTPRAPSQGPIRVVMHGEAIPGAYEEIALLQVQSDGGEGTRQSSLEALQNEARKVGANGLIEVLFNETYAVKDHPNDGYFLASAVAVYFGDAAAALAEPTAESTASAQPAAEAE